MPYPNISYRLPSRQYPEISYIPTVCLPTGEACEIVRPEDYPWLSWFAMPLPDYSFAIEPSTRERKVDELIAKCKHGVARIQNSEIFRQFLLTMSKFHDYSYGNQVLIMLQRPTATRVAGFVTWKELGRYVLRGETGIAVLAPCFGSPVEGRWIRNGTEWAIRKVQKDYAVYLLRSEGVEIVPQRSIETFSNRHLAERYLRHQGAVRSEERELSPAYFMVVYVFDVSQTGGKPLPEVKIPVLTGEANEELFAQVITLAGKNRLTVSFVSRPEQNPEIKGMLLGQEIWVRPEEARSQQLKTLIHEMAHYYTERVFAIPRQDAETIAESSAFTVAAHFGFDTGTRSFPYVALWSRDIKVLEKNLASIRNVSSRMIDALEEIEGQPSYLRTIKGTPKYLTPEIKKLKHSVELHREYVAISDKPITEMTNRELQVVRTETPSFVMLEQVEQELKRRGLIEATGQEVITQMTGGKIVEENPIAIPKAEVPEAVTPVKVTPANPQAVRTPADVIATIGRAGFPITELPPTEFEILHKALHQLGYTDTQINKMDVWTVNTILTETPDLPPNVPKPRGRPIPKAEPGLEDYPELAKTVEPTVAKGGFVAPSPKGSVGQAVVAGLKQAKKTGKDVYVFPTAEGMKLDNKPPPFGIQHIIVRPDGTHQVVSAATSFEAGRKAGVEPVSPAKVIIPQVVTPATQEITIGEFTETLKKVIAETKREIRATTEWLRQQRTQLGYEKADERTIAEEIARVASLEDRLPTLQAMLSNPEAYYPRLQTEFPNLYQFLLDRGRELKIIPRKLTRQTKTTLKEVTYAKRRA